MEQAIQLVPTLRPWVKRTFLLASTLADMDMKKKWLCNHLKGRKQLFIGLNSIIWLQSLANISAVTLTLHYYSFRCCVIWISMIILIVYYYLLLAIPYFAIISFYCFSCFGLFSRVQQQILAAQCPCYPATPIIGSRVKPKQQPPQTP